MSRKSSLAHDVPLIQQLQKLQAKPPRKFSPALISEIFVKTENLSHLQSLYESDYFSNTLWPHFHQDVTNQHIQLILLVLVYSVQYAHDNSLFEYLTQNSDEVTKFGQFIKRILQASLHPFHGGGDIDAHRNLMCSIFLFLGHFIMFDESILTSHAFFDRWLESNLSDAQDLINLENPDASEELICRHFAFFLSRSCLIEESKIAQQIIQVQLPAYLGKLTDVITKEFCGQMWQFIRANNTQSGLSQFDNLRLKAGELKIDQLSQCMLQYDVNAAETEEFIQGLPIEKLKSLAKAVGYQGDCDIPEVLSAIVTCNVFLMTQDELGELSELGRFSELQLFDWHDWRNILPVAVPIARLPQSDSAFNLLFEWEFSISKRLNDHLITCLRRLDLSEGSARGKSKYVFPVGSMQRVGKSATIGVSSASFGVNEMVVMWKIDKCNKYDEHLRMQQFGVSQATVGFVEDIPNSSSLKINMDFPRDDYDSIVRLPFQDLRILRRITGKTVSKNLSHLMDISLEKPVGSKPENLLEKGISLLEDCHFSEKPALSEYLHPLLQQQEKCLIIMPSRDHVTRINFSRTISMETLKIGDKKDLDEKIRFVNGIVKQISEILGLGEFDFASSFQNMLMLYHVHVHARWEDFMKQLSLQRKTWGKYPFGKLRFNEEDNPEICLMKIVQDYYEIQRGFALVERMLLLDKEGRSETRCLWSAFPLVVVAVEDLDCIDEQFKNVVSFVDEATLSVLGKTERLTLCGEKGLFFHWLQRNITCAKTENQLIRKETPGLPSMIQRIRTVACGERINIEEAKYVVTFCRYLGKLGFSENDILLVVCSPYMKLLMEEMFEENDMTSNHPLILHIDEVLVPSNIVVMLLHGTPTFLSTSRSEKYAMQGFFVFGEHEKNQLEISTNDSIQKVRDEDHLAKLI